jgi:hypothetical protein
MARQAAGPGCPPQQVLEFRTLGIRGHASMVARPRPSVGSN